MCLLQIQRGGFFKLSLERGRERERIKRERAREGLIWIMILPLSDYTLIFFFFITQKVSFYLTTLPGLGNQIILMISQYCWGQTYWRLTSYTHLQFQDDKKGKQIPFAQRDDKKRACAAAYCIISCSFHVVYFALYLIEAPLASITACSVLSNDVWYLILV